MLIYAGLAANVESIGCDSKTYKYISHMDVYI